MTCPGQQTETGEGAVEVEVEAEGGRRQQWGWLGRVYSQAQVE